MTMKSSYDWDELYAAAIPENAPAVVAIEAAGVPATFELGTLVIRPGGRVANIGVHSEPATLHLETSGSTTSPSSPAWSTPTPPRPC